MRLRSAVFLRFSTVWSLMMLVLTAGAMFLVLVFHRRGVEARRTNQLQILARQLEPAMLRGDGSRMVRFLRSTVRQDPFWRYAFVERNGVAVVSTFLGDLPRQLPRGSAGSRFVFLHRDGSVLIDLAAAIPHSDAVLHMGLDRRAIECSARPLLFWIAVVGVVAVLLGLMLSYWAARRTSREVHALVDTLRVALDDPGRVPVEAAIETGKVDDLVAAFNRQMEEHRRVSEELVRHRRFLEDVVDALTYPFYVIGADGYTIRLANKAAREQGIVVGARCHELIHGRTEPCEELGHPCPLERVRSTGELVVMEHQHEAPDGSRRVVEIRAYPLVDREGRLAQVIQYTVDITERRLAEEALAESQARYRWLYSMAQLMADNLPDMLWAKDLEGKYLFANKALCRKLLMASDTDEPIGKTDLFFADRERAAHPDDPTWHTFGELCMDSDAVVLKRMKPGQFDEFGNVRGQFLCLDVHKAPLFDDSGRLIGTVGSARDVTRERRLDEARRLLETTIRQADMGVCIIDLEGTVVYANPAYLRITDFEPEELLGHNLRLLHERYVNPEVADEVFAAISARKEWAGRVEKKRKDGTRYVQGQTIKPVHGEDGRVTHMVAYIRDVTAEVDLEARYLQAQKLETVGRLAGGIAHDFNNLLAAVRAYAELLELRLDGDPHALEEIREILEATRHGAALTRQLLAFARREPGTPRPLDLNRLVTEFEGMLRQLIGEDINFITRLAAELPPVLSDPAQIEQVLANLVVNARDAMPEGGRLVLETRTEAEVPGEGPPPEGGPWVVLAVQDTGVGMTEEVREHIFEPFFTTKEVGKGTGLGLSTCFGIVSQSGGHIRVESEPGRGTTVTVFLPSTREQPLQDEREPMEPELQGGSETILLVEDEAAFRRALASELRDLGYTVLEAEDGARALELWERSQGVDLLLTDEVMPGMTGSELAQRLREVCPDLPVVLVSGYMDGGSLETAMASRRIVLGKPFSRDEIARAIRDLLDGSAGGGAPQ